MRRPTGRQRTPRVRPQQPHVQIAVGSEQIIECHPLTSVTKSRKLPLQISNRAYLQNIARTAYTNQTAGLGSGWRMHSTTTSAATSLTLMPVFSLSTIHQEPTILYPVVSFSPQLVQPPAASLLPAALCLCSSLQRGRCTSQCTFWQAGLQYRASLHPPHSMPAPSCAHSAHCLGLQAAVMAAEGRCAPDLRLLLLALPTTPSCTQPDGSEGATERSLVLPEGVAEPVPLVLTLLDAVLSLARLVPKPTVGACVLPLLVLQGVTALPLLVTGSGMRLMLHLRAACTAVVLMPELGVAALLLLAMAQLVAPELVPGGP
jgi:hypothetical protein